MAGADAAGLSARDCLIDAHSRALRDGIAATDDADLVERLGATVAGGRGLAVNLKITTPDDLRWRRRSRAYRALYDAAQPALKNVSGGAVRRSAGDGDSFVERARAEALQIDA